MNTKKKQEHLPMYGVGPIYVCVIAANTLMPVSVALPPAEINQKKPPWHG